ncbi:hypothetical protein [Acidisphaera sp. L21]|uniref:hypothetical protein n=1 Tax=Acidisphaera sp. L21 TaxID=1641851 RepID=UPI00131AAB5B|nr:hypothetical protein [Acidisphaera sp. L21]
MASRRKVSAAHKVFNGAIDKLIILDGHNQSRFRAGPGRPTPKILTVTQLHVITEGIFTRAFRTFETFVEEVFVLYAMKKPSRSGRVGTPYLLPKSPEHTMELLQSNMVFLEWNSPDVIVKRSELYFQDGYPVKAAFTMNLQLLQDARWVRNHIAHNSRQSVSKYNGVLRRAYGTLPIKAISPGEFLQSTNTSSPGTHYLLSFLSGFKKVADDLTA